MPIPPPRDDGWLPEGHHPATWDDVSAVFSGESGSRRHDIFARLLQWRDAIRRAGLTGTLIVDGSFASARPEPGDSDCLFIYDDSRGRADESPARQWTDYVWCKENGYGDIFVFPRSVIKRYPELCGLDMFDYDKTSRLPKGVVEVEI